MELIHLLNKALNEAKRIKENGENFAECEKEAVENLYKEFE